MSDNEKNNFHNGDPQNNNGGRMKFSGLGRVHPDDMPTQVLNNGQLPQQQGQVPPQQQNYQQGQYPPPQQNYQQGQYPPPQQNYQQGQYPPPQQNYQQGQYPPPQQQNYQQGQYPPPQQNYQQGQFPPPPQHNRPQYSGGMQPPSQHKKGSEGSGKNPMKKLIIAIIVLIVVMVVLVILVMQKSGFTDDDDMPAVTTAASTTATTTVTTPTETDYPEITTLKALIEVPDLVDNSYTVAKMTLSDLGFRIKPTYQFSDSVAKDHVISQSIEGGVKASEGAEITLVISQGKKSQDNTTVPDVIGATLDEAREKLAKAGLTVENEGDKGKVTKQSVAAGSKVPFGTRVKITVSEG
jgi:hypothetical protein